MGDAVAFMKRILAAIMRGIRNANGCVPSCFFGIPSLRIRMIVVSLASLYVGARRFIDRAPKNSRMLSRILGDKI